MQTILALDQGTTSSCAVLYNQQGDVISTGRQDFTQHYPQPGWVEHDPLEIWQSQLTAAHQAIKAANITPQQIAAIGITNQRETTLVWERSTGHPLTNAIVWQCRRTAPLCDKLRAEGYTPTIRSRTGLLPDPYFSATKLAWILDNHPGARERANRGELLFGTVDTWLLWQLTGGAVHATDHSNAARTMLYNIHTLEWDQELCRLFNIPPAILPTVAPSSSLFGHTTPTLFDGCSIPIHGIAGDQQAALFGQGCLTPGSAKNTYGTGCFLLQNTGTTPVTSNHNLLTTIAWQINNQTTYALEGSVFTGGAAIQWLRDELGIITTAAESETLALQVPDTNGLYMIPAFTGLGAPYWDSHARGALLGLTRGTRPAHIVRAALEAIAYQTRDVLEAMQDDSAQTLPHLRADGGAAANNFLMQFQADILGVQVTTPSNLETTSLGAAALAGLNAGVWPTLDSLPTRQPPHRTFIPTTTPTQRQQLYTSWQDNVHRCLTSYPAPT